MPQKDERPGSKWYWIPTLLAPVLVPVGLARAQAGWEAVAFYPLFPTGLPIALLGAKPMSALSYMGFLVFGATALAYMLSKSRNSRYAILVIQCVVLIITIGGCRLVFSGIPH